MIIYYRAHEFTRNHLVLGVFSSFVSFGRRRHFHHIIPNPSDDVVIFTTSSQTLRTTSSFSPRHPKPSGRRRHFHHVIPNLPDDVVIFTTSSKRLFFLYIRLLIAMLLSKFQSSRSPHKKKRYFHMKVPRFIKNIIVIS